ncbi:MAG: hypothetical protein MN733_30210 [Nitrososphaera sp.]|nr:hypothetical protein [Nitrososphaera sp.]
MTKADESQRLVLEFMDRFKFDVGYWNGEDELEFYSIRSRENGWAKHLADYSLFPHHIQEYVAGSPTDLAWEELGEWLMDNFPRRLVVSHHEALIEQWEEEWGPPLSALEKLAEAAG